MRRHGPLRAPLNENALLMQWTHIATCATFVKQCPQDYAKHANVATTINRSPGIVGASYRVGKVNKIGNQERAAALPRRQPTDFRAFPPSAIPTMGRKTRAARFAIRLIRFNRGVRCHDSTTIKKYGERCVTIRRRARRHPVRPQAAPPRSGLRAPRLWRRPLRRPERPDARAPRRV